MSGAHGAERGGTHGVGAGAAAGGGGGEGDTKREEGESTGCCRPSEMVCVECGVELQQNAESEWVCFFLRLGGVMVVWARGEGDL